MYEAHALPPHRKETHDTPYRRRARRTHLTAKGAVTLPLTVTVPRSAL